MNDYVSYILRLPIRLLTYPQHPINILSASCPLLSSLLSCNASAGSSKAGSSSRCGHCDINLWHITSALLHTKHISGFTCFHHHSRPYNRTHFSPARPHVSSPWARPRRDPPAQPRRPISLPPILYILRIVSFLKYVARVYLGIRTQRLLLLRLS